MSFVKIWIHLVFATKNRQPLLGPELRSNLCKHIAQNCLQKGVFLKAINGYHDHVHCLISLGKDQNIAKISQLIKGESSFWINKNHLVEGGFSWQDDYFAVSIGESQVDDVVKYITKQEIHHAKKSFETEVNVFINKYGWQQVSS